MKMTRAASIQLARKFRTEIRKGNLTLDEVVSDFGAMLKNKDLQGREPMMQSLHQPIEFMKLLDGALAGNEGMYVNKDISSTSPASGGNYLFQGVESHIYTLFNENFQFWDSIPKEPANGPLHQYAVKTGRGTAQFVQELDPIPTDHSKPPVKVSTPVAIGATSRGASWLEQMLAQQVGSWYDIGIDPMARELADGAMAMAELFAKATFRGTLVPGMTGTTADGLTLPYGFTGLQPILENPGGAYNNMYPLLASKGYGNLVMDQGTGKISAAINSICQKIVARGGRPTRVIMGSLPALYLDNEAVASFNTIRPEDLGAVTLGANTVGIRTVAGVLPITVENDDLIGTYNGPAGSLYSGTPVAPIFVVDDRYIKAAYIGSPTPSLFELNFGQDNNLTKRYILAYAAGLMVQAAHWMGLVRVPVS